MCPNVHIYLSIYFFIYPLNQALALARSSQDPVSQKILHEQNAEKVFLDLLTSQVRASIVLFT